MPQATGDNADLAATADDAECGAEGQGDRAIDGSDEAITCAEIARRWLAAGELPLTGAALAAKLMSGDGPLDLVGPKTSTASKPIFRSRTRPNRRSAIFAPTICLKVFEYNAQSGTFEEAPLENQIDRERILADARLRRDFKAWLLDIRHFSELDRGTILIPEEFLATGAIAADPGRICGRRACSRPSASCKAMARRREPIFRESDVAAALKKAAESGVTLQNIRSVAGFERRLNDMTCSGCHQTRGIGGFHFPGVDWMAHKPDNSTVVPASPHFFGDRIRRRDILAALRDGRRPDFSRGSPAARNCAAARNSQAPNTRTAGARIAISGMPVLPTTTGVLARGPAPRGWHADRSTAARRGWGCVSSATVEASQSVFERSGNRFASRKRVKSRI